VSAEQRDAIVAALDQALPLEPVTVRSTPTLSYAPEDATGAYMLLVFQPDALGARAIAIGYDRDQQLLLLPYDGGWAVAPAELAETLADFDPPSN
jgi:hypothetical protein